MVCSKLVKLETDGYFEFLQDSLVTQLG